MVHIKAMFVTRLLMFIFYKRDEIDNDFMEF